MATKKSNTDILVAIATIETKIDQMTRDVQEIKDGTKSDIEALKVNKISREEMVHVQTDLLSRDTDKETRLRFLEQYVWWGFGAVAVSSFLLSYFHPFVH